MNAPVTTHALQPQALQSQPLQTQMPAPSQPPQVSPEVQALLQQLEPIYVPPPVSWWPMAPGWWILIISTLTIMGYLIYWLYKRHKYSAYKRQALALLAQIKPEETSHYLKQLNALLKRTALAAYPSLSTTINQSFGGDWTTFLNRANPKAQFSSSFINALSVGPYQDATTFASKTSFDPYALHRHVKKWIQTHPKHVNSQAIEKRGQHV